MTNIIKPIEEAPEAKQRTDIPQDLLDIGLTMENLEILDYLGMKDQMFNEEVVEKANFIAEMLGDKDIQEIDINLGNPHDMTKLDKIYSYFLLEKQTQEIREKEALINKEKMKYNL